VDHHSWRPAVVTLGMTALVLVAVAVLVLRDRPADVGLLPYGAPESGEPGTAAPGGRKRGTRVRSGAARRTLRVLVTSSRRPGFWLLAGMFAVCGATTNGLMWTHFVPAAHDHGMAVTAAAGLVSVIGVFSLVGTVVSGWLTDRVDPRALLVGYYGARGVLLVLLPALFGPEAGPVMVGFAVVFGLLDVATVPPTILLCRRMFGADGAIVFGWVNAFHQVGAGAVAVLGGVVRDAAGGYGPVWPLTAALCAFAVLLALTLPRAEPTVPVPADREAAGA